MKLNRPLPRDILPLMAEEGKQMEIMMKNVGLDGKDGKGGKGGGVEGKGFEEGVRDMKLGQEGMDESKG